MVPRQTRTRARAQARLAGNLLGVLFFAGLAGLGVVGGLADLPAPIWLASSGLAAAMMRPIVRPGRWAGRRRLSGYTDELRRWVPEAVAAQVEQGLEPEAGEREVSVLFVDLRGYTSFAEKSSPREVFELLNAYSELVSSIVARHGGWLVDFHGDGLMIVFGAPEPLPNMELSALTAAQEIAREVEQLDVTQTLRAGERPVLGVGVATGVAFVGSIRTVDRLIWSVTGDPTNLAARLQYLSRELPTPIAVDAATYAGAGEVVGAHCYPSTAIRGREAPVDAWAIPAEEAPASRAYATRRNRGSGQIQLAPAIPTVG